MKLNLDIRYMRRAALNEIHPFGRSKHSAAFFGIHQNKHNNSVEHFCRTANYIEMSYRNRIKTARTNCQ